MRRNWVRYPWRRISPSTPRRSQARSGAVGRLSKQGLDRPATVGSRGTFGSVVESPVVAIPRVLVVTGSAGHGHVRAAQAIAQALRTRHPATEVRELDVLQTMPRWF